MRYIRMQTKLKSPEWKHLPLHVKLKTSRTSDVHWVYDFLGWDTHQKVKKSA